MIDGLVYKKNHVIEKQRVYQASHQPIWYRPPRSRLYMGLYKTGFTAGMLGIVFGAYTLIKGKNA